MSDIKTLPEQFASIIPRIKGPIQLAGLLFSVFSAALIYRVDPDNINALAIVGAIGLALIAIPLAFHQNVLKLVPVSQRVLFMLVLVAMLLCSFGAMAYITVKTTLTPEGARFDSKLNIDKVRYFKKADGTYRVGLSWQLFPLSTRSDQGATVFLGIATLHDEDKIRNEGTGRISKESCESVDSCVGSYVFREFSVNPVFVRAGTPGTPLNAVVDARRLPKNLRIWWEFYQREGNKGAMCGVDHQKVAPQNGLPYLAMFKGERRVGDSCYRSFGQETIIVTQR